MNSPARRLLAAADLLCGDDRLDLAAGRYRGATFALRSAVETAVDDALRAAPVDAEGGSIRAKFLCLRTCTEAETARRAKAVWCMLSQGCHYHHYELGPTGQQLRIWRDEVDQVLSHLGT